MKILVIGASGQLGSDVMKVCLSRGIKAYGPDRTQLDITNFEQVKQVVEEYQPDAIINCAAYTNVDAAENDIKNCVRVNTGAVCNLVQVCAENDITLMHISTNYVFNSKKFFSYKENDGRGPVQKLNCYGVSKLIGEFAVECLDKYFIVRTEWLFGMNGKNFVDSMLRLSESRDILTVVDDQIGIPTYTADLAKSLVEMVQTNKYGTYHITNSGKYVSLFDFANIIFDSLGKKKEMTIIPVKTEEFNKNAAVRPLNNKLSTKKLKKQGFKPLPDWKDGLRRYLKERGDLK